jgi:hypothetical protein
VEDDDEDEVVYALDAWLAIQGNDDIAQAAREGLVAVAREELERRARQEARPVRAAPRPAVPPRPPREQPPAAAPPPPRKPAPMAVVPIAAMPRQLTGADLAAWRSRRGLTQVAAAARLGVTQGTISKAESKPRRPLGPTLQIALTRILDRRSR